MHFLTAAVCDTPLQVRYLEPTRVCAPHHYRLSGLTAALTARQCPRGSLVLKAEQFEAKLYFSMNSCTPKTTSGDAGRCGLDLRLGTNICSTSFQMKRII